MKDIFRSLAIVVSLPTLIAAVYFGLFASDIYVSEARFAVRTAKGGSASVGIAALLSTTTGISAGAQETLVVSDFVHSRDMLSSVEEVLAFREHYGDKRVDPLSRLNREATQESTLSYFENMVVLQHDIKSDVLTLKVRAFSPEMAQAMAKRIIQSSERLVNTLSTRIEDDALQTAHAELRRAEERLTDASLRMTQFRNNNESINPAEESAAMLGIISMLEGKLIEVRTEYSEKRAYMRADTPQLVSLQNRINALSRQLALEKGRLVGSGKEGEGGEMSGLIESYRPLALQQELAQQQYTSALASLELARLEAQRKKLYLVTFIEPSLPDEAVEPERFLKVLTTLVFSFLTYTVGILVWSALKEHVGR